MRASLGDVQTGTYHLVMDVGTGLALLGSAKLAEQVLGPTAEYVGTGIQQWSEHRVENVRRIFEHAANKLGPEGLERPGAVPPRVLKGILDEGSFIEDELGAEYLGGVLASSRSEVSRDDRGASLVALVGRLSTYQLRTHYICYSQCQRALAGMAFPIGQQSHRRSQAKYFLALNDYANGMDFSGAEIPEIAAIATHAIIGLVREELIDDDYQLGQHADLRRLNPRYDFPSNGGLTFAPSMLGIELYCAAHGIKGNYAARFLGSAEGFAFDAVVTAGESSSLVRDLPVYEPPPPPIAVPEPSP